MSFNPFFNPFKFYDEMLDIYTKKSDEEVEKNIEEEEWVTCEYVVPEQLADELDKLVADFLKDNGYEE